MLGNIIGAIIIITVGILFVCALAVIIKNRKNGKSSYCGGNCAGCTLNCSKKDK